MTFAPYTDVLDGIRWFSYRNDASSEAPAFGLLRPTGFALKEGKAVLKVDKPNTVFQRYYYVNGPFAVAAGGYGLCCEVGQACFVAYDTGATPALGESWGAKNAEWKLFPTRPGFTILAPPSDLTGVTGRVLCRQEVVNTLVAKAYSSIASHATNGVCVIQYGAAGSEADTAWDNLTAVSGYYLSSGTIATSTRLELQWINGIWYAVASECS